MLGAHLFRHRVVVGVKPDQGRCVVIVDLNFCEIGHAIFALGENAVATTAMYFIQHLSLFTFFQQQLPVNLRDMTRDIVLGLLFCDAIL